MTTRQTILVTGCSGFIGSRVVELLCAEDDTTVIGIDNLNDYYDVRLKEYRRDKLAGLDNFAFIEMDIEDRPALAKLFDVHPFDAVVNLAARAGVRYSMENPHVYASTNFSGSLNLLSEMESHGVSKFVLASTSSLYAGQEMPFLESLPVNTPISPYAASKKAAEMMAYSYHHLYGIDVSVVRYFTVYGPAGRPDMSYMRFIQWIYNEQPITVYGDGRQTRDFTYVDDIAAGTISALKPLGYEVINLGRGDQPVSINDVIQKAENLLGKKAVVEYLPAHSADLNSTWADNRKAQQLLDWHPRTSIDDGLQECVDWFMENLPWSAELRLDTCPQIAEEDVHTK